MRKSQIIGSGLDWASRITLTHQHEDIWIEQRHATEMSREWQSQDIHIAPDRIDDLIEALTYMRDYPADPATTAQAERDTCSCGELKSPAMMLCDRCHDIIERLDTDGERSR